jgi:hypothetical protein
MQNIFEPQQIIAPSVHSLTKFRTRAQQWVSWFYLLNKVNIVRDTSFYCLVSFVYNLLGIKP